MAEKFTADEVAQAITEARGLQTAAAQRLGCARQTVARYIRDYATVRAAYEEANEKQLDTAEAALFKQIGEGNMTAIIFYLKTKGKHRGYVERQEVTGKDGGPVQWSQVMQVDPDDVDDPFA